MERGEGMKRGEGRGERGEVEGVKSVELAQYASLERGRREQSCFQQ